MSRSALSKGHCVSPLVWWLLYEVGLGVEGNGVVCGRLCAACGCCGAAAGAPWEPPTLCILVQARTVSCLFRRVSHRMETVQALAMALPCSGPAPTPGFPRSSCKASLVVSAALGRRANRKTILWAENKTFHVYWYVSWVCFFSSLPPC